MFKKVVLKNGLTIIFFNDNTKNRTSVCVYNFVGGRNNHFIYDGVEYNQVRGIAHFLEHYLIEKSRYGNIMSYFNGEYIHANGATNAYRTLFYFTTVHDFEENYIKLLNIVNNPSFDEDKINDVKKPIIAEINKELDDPNNDFLEYVGSLLYNNPTYGIVIGTPEDINNMAIDDIRIFHEAFYQPKNQLIVITGKFDEEEIIKITEKEYDSFKKDYKELIVDDYKESASVVKETGVFVDNKQPELFQLYYKIDISGLSSIEKYKLDFYLSYVLGYNFSARSDSYKEIREKDLSLYAIGHDCYTIDKDIQMIILYGYTDKFDELCELTKKCFEELKTTKESFEEFKNRTLLSVINKNENIQSIRSEYEENYLKYGYEDYDSIENIKSLNYEECVEMLSKLDLSNTCYIKRIKGE